jgi:hypothetical protein
MTETDEYGVRVMITGTPGNNWFTTSLSNVVFLTGYNTLLERNEKRTKEEGKHIPHYVLVNMMGKFAVPLRSEGFDEIEYVFEDYKKDSL